MKSSSNPSPKACPLLAKLCPDGSSVSATGPNCEFAPCPQITINQPSPTPDLYTESSRSATANWKTFIGSDLVYQNSGYNQYSFKYPQDWELQNSNARKILTFKTPQGNTVSIWVNAGGHGGGSGNFQTVRKETKTYPGGKVDITLIKNLDNNNIFGTYWFLNESNKVESPFFGFEIIELPSYYLSEFEKIFSQLLSTITFL